MFQDIAPHKLHIAYTAKKPQIGDYLLFTQGDNVLMTVNNSGTQTLPQYGIEPFTSIGDENPMQFLLSVDDIAFFYVRGEYTSYENTTWQRNTFLRLLDPAWIAFAVATSFHIIKWYDRNLYCGHCKTPMEHLPNARTLRCPVCDVKMHPTISPAIIAGVFDGDWLLLTKYATGEYLRFTLIAGFGEIGETFEDIVSREIMEEVGIEAGKMYYYGSQPWGFSQSLLAGFFVEGDRSKKIVMDADELGEAVWIHKDELPYEDAVSSSLTWDMIEAFRRGWKPYQ